MQKSKSDSKVISPRHRRAL